MDQFDKGFDRMSRAFIGFGCLIVCVWLAVMAGLAWLVYVLLQHFQVI